MELIAIGLATHSIDKSVTVHTLAALQLRKNKIPFRVNPNLRDLFPQAESDSELAQMVEERFYDFAIYELQKDRTLIDQCNVSTQRCHERRVLETYDTGTNYDDFLREAA